MKKTIILSALLFIIFYGCGKREQIKLILIFDKPLNEGKYPPYFNDITMPFEGEACDTEFLLKPINTVRLDINKAEVESNAWFFENTGDNTVEFSKGWLKHYFTDSLTAKNLIGPSTRDPFPIDSYLKQEDTPVFIYSQSADVEEYEKHRVYSSAQDINNAIQSLACEKMPKEVIVLINPSILTNLPPKPPDTIESPERPGPCAQITVTDGLDLKDDLMKIMDTKRSYKERDQLARETWEKYFDPMASVKMYLNPDKYPDFWESGDGQNYLIDRLAYKNSITDINIIRIEYHKENGKISAITTVECHNASEVQ